MSDEKCFACGRKLGRNPQRVDTRDDQTVFVGRECFKLVVEAGEAGYQPPTGGPRLYLLAGYGKITRARRVEPKAFNPKRNADANAFRREAQTLWQLASPYRQSRYIAARLAGQSPEDAIKNARGRFDKLPR